LAQDALCDENHLAVIPGPSVSPEYVLAYFENTSLTALAQDGAVPSLNQQIIRSLPMNVPSLHIQKQMTAVSEAIRAEEDASREVESALISLKQGLLQALLTGRDEIPESYDSLLEITP